MSIFKKCSRNNPYTLINKTLLNDNRLTLQAKGLLSYLLSLPDDWNIKIKEVIGHSKNGRDAHYETLKELIKYKYIYRKLIKNSRGVSIRTEYLVFDEPTAEQEANIIFQKLWPDEVTNTENKGKSPVDKAERSLEEKFHTLSPPTETELKYVYELRIIYKKEGEKLFKLWKLNNYKYDEKSAIFEKSYNKWKAKFRKHSSLHMKNPLPGKPDPENQ